MFTNVLILASAASTLDLRMSQANFTADPPTFLLIWSRWALEAFAEVAFSSPFS